MTRHADRPRTADIGGRTCHLHRRPSGNVIVETDALTRTVRPSNGARVFQAMLGLDASATRLLDTAIRCTASGVES